MVSTKLQKQSSIMDYVKFGFGVGVGSMLASMIYIFIALLFFIPGIVLLAKERKKPVDKQSQTNKIIAYVLMIIGAVFGMGMGFNFIASNLMTDI